MQAVKLHVGNQSIYLRDWINLDVPHPGCGLAKEYPFRVAANITDESNYYGRKEGKTAETIITEGPESNAGDVCDVYGSWQQMPFEDNSVDEILSRQVFEHLSRPESMSALTEARRVLKPGGILRLDVPDHDATLAQWKKSILTLHRANNMKKREDAETQIAFFERHLLGSRKNDWAIHMGSWRRQDLIEFCGRYGFYVIEEEPNVHFYPAFCIRFRKGTLPRDAPITDERAEMWQAAWQYCGEIRGRALSVPDHWNVLEIGPGQNPWPRANAFGDIDEGNVQRLRAEGKAICNVNVESLPDEWTGKFDFVLAAHVLEHTSDPAAACASLSRVAKAGCIVCPSPMKEGLFCAHERDHNWHVLTNGRQLFFHKIPMVYNGDRWQKLYSMLDDDNVSGQQHRMWRYGDPRLDTLAEPLRVWFKQAEPLLDTVFHWQGSIPVSVFE